MNIGIFGLWGMNIGGISFGGFDTAFTEIAWRLAEQGHHVTIYCRRASYPADNRPEAYRGVRLVYVPTIDNKNVSFLIALTGSLFYAFLCGRHDVYLVANVGSGIHCLIARLMGKKVVLNVDGLDWVRAKWGWLAKRYFQVAARAALFACDVLITDADAMVDYYVREYGRKLEMIAYGAYIEDSTEPAIIAQYEVSPMQYYLVASRLVPENNADLIVEAFKEVHTDKKLLIVGSANYDSPFHQKIRNSGDPRVKLTGWINDPRLIKELHCNCYAYIHGHSVGGTNPALLKALGYGNMVLALNTPFNSEVLVNEEYGMLFEKDVQNLKEKILYVETNPEAAILYRRKAPQRVRTAYTWEKISERYLDLLKQVLNGRSDSRERVRLAQAGLLAGATAVLLLASILGR